MPYIPQEDRADLYPVSRREPKTSGELNYQITELVLSFLGDNPRYSDFNDAIGALEGAKLELYRKSVSEYENEKALLNGEVYPTRPSKILENIHKKQEH